VRGLRPTRRETWAGNRRSASHSTRRAPARDDAAHLAQAILDVKDKLGLCRVCNNISGRELCIYCSDPRRDPAVVCVVEEPHGIAGMETTRQFEGRYHVLHGDLRAWWSASGRSRKPSSPPTPRWKARPRRSTWRGCSSLSA
jgi:recombinational DNA repair protein RecR